MNEQSEQTPLVRIKGRPCSVIGVAATPDGIPVVVVMESVIDVLQLEQARTGGNHGN